MNFSSLSIIPFQFIIHHILIHISTQTPSGDDKMLIAVMRNDQKMQISEFSKKKYEAHLGIIFFMRKNWKCDKLMGEFEGYERTECQIYRKYLDILYKYLAREYVGIPTVKPKFVFFKKRIEIEGPIIYAMECLVKISQFYFIYKKKLDNKYYFKLKLLNEKNLDYGIKLETEQKLSINEMLLQLAIDTANECQQTNESLDGIIEQNFDAYLKEMFKKAEEIAKKDNPSDANKIKDDPHEICEEFSETWAWIDDVLFADFVKGQATNFKMAKYTNNYNYKGKEDFLKKYKTHLGTIHLLREDWQCAKFETVGEKCVRTKCPRYRKYLDILYEYLFRLYAESKNAKVWNQLPPLVKPIFIHPLGSHPKSLINVVKDLDYFYSKHFWQDEKEMHHKMKLVNEEELNFEIKEEYNCFHKSIKKGKQIWNQSTDLESLREEFDKTLKECTQS